MPDKRQGRTGQVTINGRSYFLFEEIGRGAASICYRAICDNKRYVVKEYFPITIASRDTSGNVIPSNEENAEETFTKKKTEFIRSAKFHQDKLHDIQQNDFLSVIEYDEENGFVVMNDTDGQTLASWAERQNISDSYVRKCIDIVKGIIDETEKYHNAGYVHLDLKAENVYKFNIENDQTLTRIFDFDSIQSIDSLYDSIQSKTAHIHTTNECYGKETRDINSQKADYITKEMLVRLDYYAIIKILHFLLYGCYEKTVMDDKTPFEEYYAECTVLNNYLGNLFYGLLKPIDKRDYTADDIKAYLNKLGFVIDNQRHWAVYSKENLRQNFKSSLMSDIRVGDTLHTMNKGISAVEQVAENYYGHLFLHGYDGGRGKTTAMKWLMFRMTCDLKPIYLYVPLNNLSGEFDIEQQICQRYSLKEIPQNATILFDGYNEVENKHIQSDFKKYIEDVLPKRNYRVIISGRNTEGLFADFICCTLTGISEAQRKRNRNVAELLGKDIFSNPMLVSLYSGIDINNIPAEAKKHMIGVVNGDKIEATTMGEALWNYFYIQIYEKSNGDERAEEEYKRFFFELLPNAALESRQKTEFTPEETKVLSRCNNLFNICRSIDWNCSKDEEYHSYTDIFNHQNYYDFFKAIKIIYEIKAIIDDEYMTEEIPNITYMAADLMGTHYANPKVTEDMVIVPQGYADSYYGNGKEVIEEENNVVYALGKNLALELLEDLRGNFILDNDVESQMRKFLRYMPKSYMNYGMLDIGLLFEHNHYVYDEVGWMPYTDNILYHCLKERFEYLNLDNEIDLPETYSLYAQTYENCCFNGSLINLQDDTAKYFTGCSFKRLKKGSSIPYSLYGKSAKKTIKIGAGLYSKDKSVLVDYVGPDKGKTTVTLFPETKKIDETFSIHCKNPDLIVENLSDYFVISEDFIYGNKGKTLDFCFRNAKHIKMPDNYDVYIKPFAFSNCVNITVIDFEGDCDNILQDCINVSEISCNQRHFDGRTLGPIRKVYAPNDNHYHYIKEEEHHINGIKDYIDYKKLKKLTLHATSPLDIDLNCIKGCENLTDLYIVCYQNNSTTRPLYISGDIELKKCRKYKPEDIKLFPEDIRRYYKNIKLYYEFVQDKNCVKPISENSATEFNVFGFYAPKNISSSAEYLNTPKNLTIHLPFEPDKDEIFGIKLKKYDI